MAGIIEVYYNEEYKGSRHYTHRKERNEWVQQQLKLHPKHKHNKIYFIDKPTEFYAKQYSQRNTPPPYSQRTLARSTTRTTQYNWREIG